MQRFSIKPISIFLIVIVAASVMTNVLLGGEEFGSINFYKKHSPIFLIFITIFPRLTLLFSSVATGGLFWWVGFIFCPRILVASLATVSYFHTNPTLVTISWVVALFGETFEKAGLGQNRKKFIFRTSRMGSRGPLHREEDFYQQERPTIKKDDAIEAEFTKKS